MWYQPEPSYLQIAYHFLINHVFRNIYTQAINHLIATSIITTLFSILLIREYMNWRRRRQSEGRPSIALSQVNNQQLVSGTTHPGPHQQQATDHHHSATSGTNEHVNKSYGQTNLKVDLTNVLNPAIVNNSLPPELSTLFRTLNENLVKAHNPSASFTHQIQETRVSTFNPKDMDAEGWVKRFKSITRHLSSAERIELLLSSIDKDSTRHISIFVDDRQDSDTLEKALDLLIKLNRKETGQLTSAWNKLEARMQQKDENIHSFGMDVMALAKNAFPLASRDVLFEYARNQFIKGLIDDEVRKRLIFSSTKDYADLLDEAMQAASVLNSFSNSSSNHSASAASQTPPAIQYQQHHQQQYQQNHQPPNQLVPYSHPPPPYCDFCHRTGHVRSSCHRVRYQNQLQNLQQQIPPAANQGPPPPPPHQQHQHQQYGNNRLNNNGVSVVTQSRFVGGDTKPKSPRINGRCLINSIPVLFQLDTGSDRTVINEETALRLKLNITRPGRIYYVQLANKQMAHIIGFSTARITLGSETFSVELLIIKDLAKSCLLGLDFLMMHSKYRTVMKQLFDLTSNTFNMEEESPEEAISKDPEAFSVNAEQHQVSDQVLPSETNASNSTGASPVPSTEQILSVPERVIFANMIEVTDTQSAASPENLEQLRTQMLGEVTAIAAESLQDLTPSDLVLHKIQVLDETPIRQKIRPIPHNAKERFKALLFDLLKSKLIRYSDSGWRSPINLVDKPDGSLRMTLDYKKLNAVTIKDAYPLPNIADMYSLLAKAVVYSKFDLASGYYQIQMDPESRKYTAFGCEFGLFEFNVLSMGLTNAVATFARVMNEILKDYIGVFVLVYIDDILIYSASIEEHIKHVRIIISVLAKYGFKVKPSKCDLFKQSVKFLGHVISPRGLEPNPDLVSALYQTPVPSTLKQVKSFVGLATYYRKFIKNFSVIASPLYAVKEISKNKIEWTKECQTAYDTLRDILASDLVLVIPDFDKPFSLATDSSDYGMGAVLAQTHGDQERPVAYFSKSLSKAERNYSTSEKELYAIVASMEHFKHYLYGKRFTVYSDHKPLSWLLTCEKPSQQLARWLIRIERFNFEIVYKEGPKNGNADGLSRMPPDIKDGEDQASNEPEEETNGDYIICNLSVEAAINLFSEEQKQEQLMDPDIKWIYELVEKHGEAKPAIDSFDTLNQKDLFSVYESLTIKEENIYRQVQDEFDRSFTQFLLPESQVDMVLRNMHESQFSGHLGIDKTWQRIKDRFYFPNMRSRIRKFVQECDKCQKIKSTKQLTAPLKPIRSTRPRQIITTDITGPLPTTTRNNNCILVVCDHFSKYTVAYAMPNQLASTVANSLVKYFCIFGLPEAILSDRGTNFQSALVSELLDLLDIHRLRTTAFHSMGNGQVEKFNRTIKDMLTAYIAEEQNDWDAYLDQLTFAYNSASHAATGFSPFEVHFGERPRVPLDIFFSTLNEEEQELNEEAQAVIVSDYVTELQERLKVNFGSSVVIGITKWTWPKSTTTAKL